MPSVLLPTAFALVQSADAGFWDSQGGNPNVMGYGPAAGALIIGRDDLVRVRTSLGRINDELHLILGVLDQHLSAPPMPASTNWPEDDTYSREARHGHFEPPPEAMPRVPQPSMQAETQAPKDFAGTSFGWMWTAGEWIVFFALIALDIGIVVMMQLFLESIGRKRGGSGIMAKKSAANLAATNAADGLSIPAPTITPASSQRLSVLSQDELLAAALTEHWLKLMLGGVMALLVRLPAHFLSPDSLTCNMLMNLAIMVRCMSVVMLLLGDEMTLPKKVNLNQPPGPPSPPGSERHRGHDSMR